jgi:hypothetical protein
MASAFLDYAHGRGFVTPRNTSYRMQASRTGLARMESRELAQPFTEKYRKSLSLFLWLGIPIGVASLRPRFEPTTSAV